MNFCPECGIECDSLPEARANGSLILLGKHDVGGIDCLKGQIVREAEQFAAAQAKVAEWQEFAYQSAKENMRLRAIAQYVKDRWQDCAVDVVSFADNMLNECDNPSTEDTYAAAQSRIAELESHLNTLTGYVTTCQTINLDSWLERLLEHINKSCDVLNDRDRFRAIKCGMQMHFKRATNSGPAAEANP